MYVAKHQSLFPPSKENVLMEQAEEVSKPTPQVQYCMEFKRKKCRTIDGLIGPNPSHFCIICKDPIHCTCGVSPSEFLRAQYVPETPIEGSGAGVVCSACKKGLTSENNSIASQYSDVDCRVIDEVLPANVRVFTYTESSEPPVQRTFAENVHIACALGSNPFMKAELLERKRIILPGIRDRSICTDKNLKMAKRAKSAEKSRRYRARNRDRVNESARGRYHSKHKQSRNPKEKGNNNGEHSVMVEPKNSHVQRAEIIPSGEQSVPAEYNDPVSLQMTNDSVNFNGNQCQGEYRVHTVTDIYEIKRFFHVFQPREGALCLGKLLAVKQDKSGQRRLLCLKNCEREIGTVPSSKTRPSRQDDVK